MCKTERNMKYNQGIYKLNFPFYSLKFNKKKILPFYYNNKVTGPGSVVNIFKYVTNEQSLNRDNKHC